MELIFIDKDKPEIFGAKDDPERKVNIKNKKEFLFFKRKSRLDLGENIQQYFFKTYNIDINL
jgi:hypothetical protein